MQIDINSNDHKILNKKLQILLLVCYIFFHNYIFILNLLFMQHNYT